MASPFQQQALRRKLVYIGLIVVLFSATLLFRSGVVETQGDALALREQNVGTVELSGSAVRLSLTGLRGVASCALWWYAIDKQKKNQWDELEMLVRSITKLQPHFISPWLFQSWNLSYNVSVQCDRPVDKYFYIARGIELLSEGERQNRYQPELRFAMGTYYQQKISMHDHKIPLQNLFEMSGIDPVHRDPDWLREKDRDGRPRFESYFCKQHPRLARRLREKLGYTTQEQVLRYLRDNNKIPSIFGDRLEGEGDEQHTRLKLNRDEPFPMLPQEEYDAVAMPNMSALEGGEFDAFAAAREWFAYAQKALPDPDDEMPGRSKPIEDHVKEREPQHMTTMIFRNFPARAQAYVAERLEEEGWFDSTGWKLTSWFPGDKFAKGEPSVIGVDRNWAGDPWQKAFQMWEEHGLRNHLILSPEKEADLEQQAELFRKTYDRSRVDMPTDLRPEHRTDPAMQESFKAHAIIWSYDHYRGLTNFPHFYNRAKVECTAETVGVRRALYEAEELRLQGKALALGKYESALKGWAKVLAEHPEFRSNQQIQEDSFELEWNYLQLLHDSPTGRQLKQQSYAEAFVGQSLTPSLAPALLSLAQLSRSHAVAAPVILGPLDGRDANGHALLEIQPVEVVLRRKGLIRAMTVPPEMMEMMKRRGMGMGGSPMPGGPAGPGNKPMPSPPRDGATPPVPNR